MKKTARSLVMWWMGKRGYSGDFGIQIVKSIVHDVFHNKNTTAREKIWSYRRGFFSNKIEAYGLTNENYNNFLSDFDYARLYPINHKIYSRWMDDKLTLKYVLAPFNEYLPEYYVLLRHGQPCYLMDYTGQRKHSANEAIRGLMRDKKRLAVKPVLGSKGEGFHKLSMRNERLFWDEVELSAREFDERISLLNDYLVTEYLMATSAMRRIYPNTPGSIRVMMINANGKAFAANAFIRFGTSRTGMVDNAAAGGIFCMIDIDTGRFSGGIQTIGYDGIKHEVHPDSKESIQGTISGWHDIISKVEEMCGYMSGLEYMGFDIVLTDKGFKVIEINSHQAINRPQFFKPLLHENAATAFFERKLSRHIRK